MISCSVRTFTDPDECAAAQNNSTNETTVWRSGAYSAKHVRIVLPHIHMQRLSESLPRTTNVQMWPNRAALTFQTAPGPCQMRNGVESGLGVVQRTRPGQSYYEQSSGPASIASVSLSIEDMAIVGPAVLGQAHTPHGDTHAIRPSPETMGRLLRLHAAAGTLAEDAPEVLANPDAVRGIEQALTEVMLACIAGEAHEDRTAQGQHAAIMRRFQRAIERSEGQPLYIPELCREVGASVRTLQACCHEHLGMGPKHYLLLRRMNMVRRALQEGSPSETTITEVATRYGFWQFGRLAVEYKALFGETPSATLARPA
jgi:AraC-like DNA-binding protein